MQFQHVSPALIERDWAAISEILAPAIRQDPKQTIEGIKARLLAGADHLLAVSGGASGLVVLEVTSGLACWTKYIAGRIDGGPKARAAFLRAAIQTLETVARDAGCTEHCICGRDWHPLLPDYEPLDGFRNGLRKGL